MKIELKERYRLYREHKFLRATLSNLENQIASADFTDSKQVLEIQNRLEGVLNIIEYHAKHENEVIHPLLKSKGFKLIDNLEADHENYIAIFENLKYSIKDILQTTHQSELIRKGYEFYIAFRQFLAMDLRHINEEELVIMPELQKYYSNKELKENVDFPIYSQMSTEELVEMMSALFPHMNIHDKEHFLSDIQEAQPEKFLEAWQGIASSIDKVERDKLVKMLNL